MQRTDLHADTTWHEVDEEGRFVVLSDEEEELQVVQEEKRPQGGNAKDVQQEEQGNQYLAMRTCSQVRCTVQTLS